MPLGVEIEVRFGWINAGGGNTLLAQQQANVPGQGNPTSPAVASGLGVAQATGQLARTAFSAQVMQFISFEPVPVAAGSEGSVTVANLNTALTNAIADITGASGTPFINAAVLAVIQGWATGGP